MDKYEALIYDNFPLSIIIYEVLRDNDGNRIDYRIIYGNKHFSKDYAAIYGKNDYLGALAVEKWLIDDYTLSMMDKSLDGEPEAFSTYIPHIKLHVHMEPLPGLPDGQIGYVVTDIADFDEQESRVNFMRAISQLNNIACLIKQNDDGSITTVYATQAFCDLMECKSLHDACSFMDGNGYINSTHRDDREKVLRILKNRDAEAGSKGITLRKISEKGNEVWCNAHYAFIDEWGERYVYCTYANVDKLKRYEDQLQSIYMSLGENFYQADEDTLVLMQSNLTTDRIEDVMGVADFNIASEGLPYSDALVRRAEYFPIEEERAEFLRALSAETLIKAYLDGEVKSSMVLYSRLPDDSVSYVKITTNVTRHPVTDDMIVFIKEEPNNPEKLLSTIRGKILAKQFDLVAYIARDRYDVAIGDSDLIEHGNIFPKERSGSYINYIESQIISALKGDEEYRQQIREAMSLDTVFRMLQVREPYSVDIEVEMPEGVFYKRFDFYSVDPESEYCIVLKTDTTEVRLEQKRQEENARELEYSKKELADAEDIIAEAGFGMWHIVLEDGKEPRMRGNEKMKELLGITGQELTEEEVYAGWYSRIVEADIPSVQNHVAEMLAGQFAENTYRWEHPEWGTLWVRCGGTATQDGTQQLLRGYHSDVTDIVREDMAKREALSDALTAAEHANRAKTSFLNNMSHDIRTPMNAIVGFTALAASHIDNKEQVEDYLSKISISSQHLLSLVNDVLDMSRIESGKMTLEEAEVNLPELIHELHLIIQANISAKQLDLFIDTQDVIHEDIITDKLRLNQVFLNILSNAIKFTPSGGSISFRVIEKPSLSDELTSFEFRIKDSGIGMSEEFQKNIFDAFTREKTSTVSGIQGTGLGMAITKNIVDMMGGTISVNSREGMGTEFIVTIPCKVGSYPVKAEAIPEIQGLRALVADDDTNTCLSICNMLSDMGMRADWTNYGKEAVIRTKQALDQGDPFRTYIIDWQMPDMNGVETVRRIRKIAGDNAPVIILTAYDWADIEEEAKEAGVTAFCSKPLFMSELNRVLAEPFIKHEAEDDSEEVIDFAGKRILLAEDNEMNQQIAEAILTEVGFEIDIASDGKVAVQKMKESPAGTYDVILMDIQMPHMNGYEAASAIRKLDDPEKADIPIIAVTANAFEEDRRLALEAGMNGHLAKPYDIPKMLGALSEILK